MKKRAFAILLSVLLLFSLSVTAFASDGGLDFDNLPFYGEDSANSDEYDYSDGDIYDFDDIYDYDYSEYEDVLIDDELFEELFEDPAFEIYAVLIALSVLLFVPALVVMIIFIVLNSKTKKKLKEYEHIMFGGVNTGDFGNNGGMNAPRGFNGENGFNAQNNGSYPPQNGFNAQNYGNNPPQNGFNAEGGSFNNSYVRPEGSGNFEGSLGFENTEKADAENNTAENAGQNAGTEGFKKFVDASVLDDLDLPTDENSEGGNGNA